MLVLYICCLATIWLSIEHVALKRSPWSSAVCSVEPFYCKWQKPGFKKGGCSSRRTSWWTRCTSTSWWAWCAWTWWRRRWRRHGHGAWGTASGGAGSRWSREPPSAAAGQGCSIYIFCFQGPRAKWMRLRPSENITWWNRSGCRSSFKLQCLRSKINQPSLSMQAGKKKPRGIVQKMYRRNKIILLVDIITLCLPLFDPNSISKSANSNLLREVNWIGSIVRPCVFHMCFIQIELAHVCWFEIFWLQSSRPNLFHSSTSFHTFFKHGPFLLQLFKINIFTDWLVFCHLFVVFHFFQNYIIYIKLTMFIYFSSDKRNQHFILWKIAIAVGDNSNAIDWGVAENATVKSHDGWLGRKKLLRVSFAGAQTWFLLMFFYS